MLPALAADGFKDVELFGPQSQPDGDFPNVPGHVANPENPAVFNIIIDRAKEIGADLILASDPDCDRLGAAAALTFKAGFSLETIHRQPNRRSLGRIRFVGTQKSRLRCRRQHYVVKTLVTTEMVRRIADHFGVETHGNLQVGFKWIGQEIDAAGPDNFVFGCEESHGYLVGTHVRDKDAAVAAMLLAELAATGKAAGKTLHEMLDALYWQFGYHAEIQFSLTMPGAAGMHDMQRLMARFRSAPPLELAGLKVQQVRDYESLTQFAPGEPPQKLDGPRGDMVMLDLAATGNYVAVRPSGTEPKVKFYMFSFEPAEQIANLDATKTECAQRLREHAARLIRIREMTIHYADRSHWSGIESWQPPTMARRGRSAIDRQRRHFVRSRQSVAYDKADRWPTGPTRFSKWRGHFGNVAIARRIARTAANHRERIGPCTASTLGTANRRSRFAAVRPNCAAHCAA